MTKLLCLSDSPFLNTGFSTISMNILNRLTTDYGYDCSYMGNALPHPQQLPMLDPEVILKSWGISTLEAKGLPKKVPSIYLKDGTSFKFNLIGQAMEPYCKDIIEPTIQRLQPDIFFTLLDTFMVHPWYSEMNFSPAKSIFYFPTDGEPFLPGNVCDVILKKANKAVAMSKFAKQQAKEAHGLDTEYIPHAVEERTFYPLSEEEKKNNRIKWGLQGKFVVGCVARNQPRKMMDRTIKAFTKFAKDKDDVVLVLHMDPLDRAAAFNISQLIQVLNIQNKVVFTGTRYFEGFAYEQMREVYNLFDVFCLLTSGEGFGVPIIEAMACEVPVIATDYTTTNELVEQDGKSGESVKLADTESYLHPTKSDSMLMTLTGSWNVERGVADISDASKQLNKLYYERELIKIYGKTGYKKVRKYYTWNIVMPRWHELIQKMVNE